MKINIEQNQSETKNRAVSLIHHLTGENLEKLFKMPLDELITLLSNLMQCAEEHVEVLLRKHDQNKELNPQTITSLWKLISKGVLKRKKHTLGTLEEETYNQIKFIMAQLGDLTRFRAENGLSSLKALPADLTSQKKVSNIVNNDSFAHSYQASVATSQPRGGIILPKS